MGEVPNSMNRIEDIEPQESEIKLISIKQAATKGIERLYRPIWACKFDHLKIDIIDGRLGPWIHLYAPFNKECNGRDPFSIIVVDFDCDEEDYLPYIGPLPDSDDYRKIAKSYEGVLKNDIVNGKKVPWR